MLLDARELCCPYVIGRAVQARDRPKRPNAGSDAVRFAHRAPKVEVGREGRPAESGRVYIVS